MSSKGKALRGWPLILLVLTLVTPALAFQLRSCPTSLAQGEMAAIEVQAKGRVRGSFAGEPLIFFSHTPGLYRALIGVDLEAEPGPRDLQVVEGERVLRATVMVKSRPFGLQHLDLPPEMVELKGETLRRVRREKAMIRRTLSGTRPQPLWRRPFLLPLRGRITGAYGLRRLINGRFRSRHTGVDIAAPEGTPVVATNDGLIVLASNLYLEGNAVIMDHGLGLYSLYFHLKESFVRRGQRVQRGEVLGLVGMSGRASGPHLHWGVVLRGKRIDPLSLLEVLGERGWKRGLSRMP